MKTHAEKKQESKSQSVSNGESQLQGGGEVSFQLVDNRPESVAQLKLQEMANNSPQDSRLRSLQEIANNSPQGKQAAQLKAMFELNTATPIQQKKENGITQLAHAPKFVDNPGVAIQRVDDDSLKGEKSPKEEALETIQRNKQYYLRFALELRKMVKREIPEGEMALIWRRFSSAMKNHEVLLPKWGEINWGKDEARKKEVDTTEIQLAKLEAFREDIQFLTKLVETDQGEELQVNNVTLWSNINIGRPAANSEELNEKMGVIGGGTPLNRTSMGALLDLFAVGALEGGDADFKNVNGDLLLNDNNSYMQWGGSFNVWAAVSADFAAKATGDVHVYVPTGTGTGSVFWTAELPELRKNPNVKSIFVHELSGEGKEAVAKEKAKAIDKLELQTILKSPNAWTTSTISGLTVTGAGGGQGVSAGKLRNMGNKWRSKAT